LTVIFTNGDFWIESVVVTVTLEDAAGRYTGVTALTKHGRFVGGSVGGDDSTNNDNTQAVAGVPEIKASGGGLDINYGDPITQIALRVTKQAGTAGNTIVDYFVLVYLRK